MIIKPDFGFSFFKKKLLKAKSGFLFSVAFITKKEVLPVFCGAVLFALFFVLYKPSDFINKYGSAIYSSDGELLSAITSKDGQWCFEPDNNYELPSRFVNALINYEDKRFSGHTGFDPIAITRAFFENLKNNKIISGASTITMQVSRLSRTVRKRNLKTKIEELWIALSLELHNTKADILKLYASKAPFGGNVIGLEAAGFRWYGRKPELLSWGEACTLAVLPNNPSMVNPGKSREMLKAKRDKLLAQLYKKNIIDDDIYSISLCEELPIKANSMPSYASHLLSKSGPGRVSTTIDSKYQKLLENACIKHVNNLSKSGITNMAAIIMRISDSAIISYVGNVPSDNYHYENKQYTNDNSYWVDCASSSRSSGSILKPFLYAAMLDSGEILPQKLIPDIPTRVGSYSPENITKTFSGAIKAEEALASSLNIPFVRLLRSYGVERFASLLKKLGITTLNRSAADYGLTLILGGAEVKLIEAAAMYASLARCAEYENDSSNFCGSFWAKNKSTKAATSIPFSPGAARLTLDALVNVSRPGEEASWQEYASSQKIAWKTGTSFGSRDAWAIGVNREYVVAVWVGNADGEGRPELRGSTAAAPLMFNAFQFLPRTAWFSDRRDSLKYVTVCQNSGFIASKNCKETEKCLVPKNSNIESVCPYCKIVTLTSDEKFRVKTEKYHGDVISKQFFILPPTMEVFYIRSGRTYKKLPPWFPGMEDTYSNNMEIISPTNGTSIFIPIDFDGKPGMTIFSLAHRDNNSVVYWHLDDDYIGKTENEHKIEYRPLPGYHRLVVVDQNGSTEEVTFYVYNRE